MELKWIEEAKSHLGTKEIPGAKSNPKIINWAKSIGGWISSFFKNDDIPWCGLFVGYVMKSSGYEVTISNPLGAREWLNYGKKTNPRYGAIMVFSRSGGGHVGFYVSEDDTTYHILGGNQSNMVNVARIDKSRFVGARWPNEDDTTTKAIRKKFDGKISTNEA